METLALSSNVREAAMAYESSIHKGERGCRSTPGTTVRRNTFGKGPVRSGIDLLFGN